MRDDALVRFTAHELPREDLHALMTRSDGPALRRAAWHLGMLILTGTVLWRLSSSVWALPLVVVQGYMLAFVFCALHETAHRTAFQTRWLNPALGTLAGLLGFWPYRNYRVYHWDHHGFTQDQERDPELYFPKPASLPVYLFVLTGIPNAIRRIGDILRLASGRADRPWMAPSERRPLIGEARPYLTGSLAVAAVPTAAGSPAGPDRMAPGRSPPSTRSRSRCPPPSPSPSTCPSTASSSHACTPTRGSTGSATRWSSAAPAPRPSRPTRGGWPRCSSARIPR